MITTWAIEDFTIHESSLQKVQVDESLDADPLGQANKSFWRLRKLRIEISVGGYSRPHNIWYFSRTMLTISFITSSHCKVSLEHFYPLQFQLLHSKHPSCPSIRRYTLILHTLTAFCLPHLTSTTYPFPFLAYFRSIIGNMWLLQEV